MKKIKINYLILLALDCIYIVFQPKSDTLKELVGAMLIGGLFYFIGFYIDEKIINKNKKNGA